MISRKISSIALADICNIDLQQGVFDRLLNIGVPEFVNAASLGIEIIFLEG